MRKEHHLPDSCMLTAVEPRESQENRKEQDLSARNYHRLQREAELKPACAAGEEKWDEISR